MIWSRRGVLRTGTGVIAGLIPFSKRWKTLTPDQMFLDAGIGPDNEARMRALVDLALDVAKRSGATYADVRISFSRSLGIFASHGETAGPSIGSGADVGIRAVTHGVWGFAGRSVISEKGVTALAELAVARSRAARPIRPKNFEFVPAPVVPDGRWESPWEVDPFGIGYPEHEQFLYDAAKAVHQVAGPKRVGTYGNLNFSRQEVYFGSSEGSRIYQRLRFAGTNGSANTVSKKDPDVGVGASTDCPNGQYGHEAIAKSNLKEEWLAAVAETLRLAELPVKNVDVGRYDVVLGKGALAEYVDSTIVGALFLNRARGDLTNGAGTSYAAPPNDVLGKLKASSAALTVSCDRSRKHAAATIGWDSDGVKPDEFTLVKDGIVVDYITNRETAGTIDEWYRKSGKTTQSHGCAMGWGGSEPYLGRPNITIKPGPKSNTVDELLKGIKRGFYIVNGGVGTDQQVINCVGYGSQPTYEVINGKPGALVKNFATVFNTTPFWSKLDALGGPETGGLVNGVQSVAARIRQVSVINTGKEG